MRTSNLNSSVNYDHTNVTGQDYLPCSLADAWETNHALYISADKGAWHHAVSPGILN